MSKSKNETVARIELDAETRPKQDEQSCGRGEAERNPSGEEDSERKNGTLGKYNERQGNKRQKLK